MTEQELIAKFYKSIKEQTDYPEYSIGWWLSQLPSHCVDKAIANVIQQFGTKRIYRIEKNCSVKQALRNHCLWEKTYEGYDYWRDIYNAPLGG